jgi:hypothetical protein
MARMTKTDCPACWKFSPFYRDPLAVILTDRVVNGDSGDWQGYRDDGSGFNSWDGSITETLRECRALLCSDCCRDVVDEIKQSAGLLPYVEWDSQGFYSGGFETRERIEAHEASFAQEDE